MNPASTMGTIISETHLQRIEKMVQKRPASARILAGGKRLKGKSTLDGFDFSRGLFYPPTVIDGVETHDELWREEVFGPVVVVKKFNVSIFLLETRLIDNGWDRRNLKACFWLTRASTASEQPCGRRTSAKPIASLQRLKLDWFGLTPITVMIQVRHGAA